MSEHLCEQCGAENAPDAQFCATCDFYLGWDTGGGSLHGTPLTSAIPVVRETHSQKFPAVTGPIDQTRACDERQSVERRPEPPRPVRDTSRSRPIAAPRVTIESPEVVIDPDTGGTVDIAIRNMSSIVDGYRVEAPNAPRWLEIEHPEIRLLTDEEGVTTVTVRIRPRFDVYVQRFHQRIQVCSVEDPAKRADAELVVVVPRVGGPVTITAEPQVVRLRDQTTGYFRLRLDNSGSNYPQRFALQGSDPERIVRFAIQPPVIEVGPMRAEYVNVRFDAPAPDPGQQANHTLTVSAASDEGRLDTVVNVVQQTSQAPADSPVRLRLEPTVTRIRDVTAAEVAIIVDNRRGSRDRRLYFSGRDPEGQVRFRFSQPQLYVRAGDQARVYAQIQAPLPRPGDEVERPFFVVCNDGTDESEASGSLVQAASASPITTAELHLEPERVAVRNRRRGNFRVTVDNTASALPLGVWLSGTDPDGAVRFTFTPQRLDVPPGGVGHSALRVWANLPGSGNEVAHEIEVHADDGVGSVEAQGRFTQSMSEILPLIRLLLTLLGGLLIVLGAIRPWFLGGPTYDVGRLIELQKVVEIKALGDLENIAKMSAITQPAARAVMLLLAGVMMLGILSARGRFTIVSGFLAGMSMIGYVAYAMSEFGSKGPAYGALLVVVGAVVGIVGGFCIKRGGSP